MLYISGDSAGDVVSSPVSTHHIIEENPEISMAEDYDKIVMRKRLICENNSV